MIANHICEQLLAVKTTQSEKSSDDNKMWAVYGQTSFFPCEKSVETLPPGQYVIKQSDNGIYFEQRSVQLDSLFRFPDTNFDQVVNDIELFWERQYKFREFGFLWKRGILLYGPPGSGKTSLLQIIADTIITKGGIVVIGTDPHTTSKGLHILRKIEPLRPIIVILEDIDAIVTYGESELLALLDGELQVDNIVVIATTNYPERLDKRLINRPSRFDVVKKIDTPSKTARQMYLKHKNPNLSDLELQIWTDATEHFSMAHLKELIVSVECLGNTFDDTITRLRNMMESEPCSDEYTIKQNSFGFIDKSPTEKG